MRLTIQIADEVAEQLKREAARQRCTLNELVEAALRIYFPQLKRELSPLPTLDSAEILVDVANREALYEAMDGPELRKMYGTPDPE